MMQIGPYKLSSNLVLAPMAGITDRPFRQLCRRFGAGLAVSEMISADTSLWSSRKTLTRLDHEGEDAPVSVQIVGSDPAKMALAARINVDHGAQIIDINMGCPAKKVCRVAAGSALLQDEPLVTRILEAVVGSVAVPVTLKIRTGWDKENRNGVQIARIAEQSGVQALAVHGRTRACGVSGEAEHDTIQQIKSAVKLPIIANGDIDQIKKAKQILKSTGVDGIMIGRAAQGRPWVFSEINHYLQTGEQLPEPAPSWIRDILLEHLQALYSLYGKTHGVRIARKHIAWYSRHRHDAAAFRKTVNQATNTEDQTKLIQEYFNRHQLGEGLAA
jgi:tRNA-dihydrouridine synthase B